MEMACKHRGHGYFQGDFLKVSSGPDETSARKRPPLFLTIAANETTNNGNSSALETTRRTKIPAFHGQLLGIIVAENHYPSVAGRGDTFALDFRTIAARGNVKKSRGVAYRKHSCFSGANGNGPNGFGARVIAPRRDLKRPSALSR